MPSPVRRAAVFAGLCTLSLAVPLFGVSAGVAIAAVLAVGGLVLTDGPVFDLLASPADYHAGRLYGLVSFVLAAVALGLIAVTTSLSLAVFVGTIVLVGYGSLAETLAETRSDRQIVAISAFLVAATLAGVAGQLGTNWVTDTVRADAVPLVIFLATAGALLAAILRDVLWEYDDPIVMLAVGLLLWILTALEPVLAMTDLAIALAVTVGLGYVSYALGTASIAGMLTGIFLGLVTIVLGGYGWFAVLIAFFAIGGLSTKYKYDRKSDLGVAEDNDGARGSGNVLANAAVALLAVFGYAATTASLLSSVPEPALFLFAFAGSVATAMSDTLSSEIGSVFEQPRLITTLQPVEPGTDGGVTWQGEVAGLIGAAIVGAIAYLLFPVVDTLGAAIILAAGFVGMTVDSLLGATLEGSLLGNQGVNFLATLAGAIVCALAALVLTAPV